MSVIEQTHNPTTHNPTIKETRIGNLTGDPVLRYSAKGAAWATMAVAVDRRAKDAGGTWQDLPPEFYDVVCFGDLAENVATCLAKGGRVVIVGRIEEDTWTGRDGNERTTAKVVADDIGTSLRRGTVEVNRTKRWGPGHDMTRMLDATTPEELFGTSDGWACQ
ncbi:MAG TPA: single-stranded DNA-binding protein [Acidimicrobiales bacterium]|nr:single-stranded DNA-binding protein [Acidimicrobiales bacterium]